MRTRTRVANGCRVEVPAKIRKKSQVTIPQEILEKLGIEPGDTIVTNDNSWRAKLTPLASRFEVCYLENHLPFP